MSEKRIIAAHDHNRVIGHNNDMPWRGDLPADIRRFKSLTLGHTVIMGRKTYESIGFPLPGRDNIVISRQEDLEIPGCNVVHSLEEAFAIETENDLFIIGGANIYRLAMPEADTLHITEIAAEFDGDTYFPEINPDTWREVSREENPADEHNKYRYTFIEYERIV